MPRSLHTDLLRRPRAVWWAVLVAVLFALAPTLTHALAYAGVAGAQRLDICTSAVSPVVAPADAHAVDSPDGQESAPTQTHCPFCLHQADRCAPAPHLLPYLLKVEGAQPETAASQAFFYLDTPPLWAPPRGPPVHFDL